MPFLFWLFFLGPVFLSTEIKNYDPLYNQINMAVLFWYLVKNYLYSARYCTRVHCLDKTLFTRYQNYTDM